MKNSTSAKTKVNKVVSYESWHCRLGHPSRQVLSNFPGINSSKNSYDPCDACLRAQNKGVCRFQLVKIKLHIALILCTVIYGGISH